MHGHTPAARCCARLFAVVTLIVLLSEPAQAYIADDRWTRTATNSNTGTQGTPITLTWSFAPDGTTIPTLTDSNLIGFLDANFGAGPGGSDFTERPWFTFFEQAFDRLGALSGVTYIYEPNDDGRSFSQFNSARRLGRPR